MMFVTALRLRVPLFFWPQAKMVLCWNQICVYTLLTLIASMALTLTQGSSLLEDENAAQPVSSGSSGSDAPAASVETFPLPPGYNKLIIPAVNGSILFVSMHLFILEITDIDEENGVLELDTELGFGWLDWHIWKHLLENKEAQTRLLAASSDGFFGIDSEFLHHIWKPDVSIQELASVDTTYLLSKQLSLSIRVEEPQSFGTIEVNARQTLRVRCEMDFTYYPADTQKCALNLLSYTYPEEEFLLSWDKKQSVYLDETSDPNYDFQVSDVEPGNELYNRYTKYTPPGAFAMNFSTLTFTIQLRRNLVYHVVQTFLPSVILILITWLCFLLPPDMIEARNGISMTTLLTIIAMFSAVREHAPKVSYPMAIDFWMVFCIHMIFLALVLFTVMYWMRTKFRKTVDPEAAAQPESPTKSVSTQTSPKSPSKSPSKSKPHSKSALERKIAVAVVKYNPFVKYSTRYAFLLFAAVFVIFVSLFALWILIASDYFNWAPSARYNAMDLEGDGDDEGASHIFVMEGTPYSDAQRLNGTMEVDKSTDTGQQQQQQPQRPGQARDHFENLLKGMICSTVKALRPDSNSTCVGQEAGPPNNSTETQI